MSAVGSLNNIKEILGRLDSVEEMVQDLLDENRSQEKEIESLKTKIEVVRNQKNKRPL